MASRLAQSYEVVGEQMTVLVTTAKEPQQEGRGVLDWLARFAAAAAFAAVVGVLGALALEQVSGKGSHPAATTISRPAPQPFTAQPPTTHQSQPCKVLARCPETAQTPGLGAPPAVHIDGDGHPLVAWSAGNVQPPATLSPPAGRL